MRTPLPDRRPNVTVNVEWNGHVFPVSIGLGWPQPQKDEEGNIVPFEITEDDLIATMQPGEGFADLGKGGDMQWVVADAACAISIAMQYGAPPHVLANAMGKVPGLVWDKETETMVKVLLPASPLGAVVEAILREVKG